MRLLKVVRIPYVFFNSSTSTKELKMTNVNYNYYLPIEERRVDSQYKGLLREILDTGHFKPSVQGPRALTVLGPRPMRFNLSNGIPLITERRMDLKPKDQPVLWKQAISEIIAYINGARTLQELKSYGCYWWDAWGTAERCAKYGLEPGDFGPGFYGPAFAHFPKQDGGTFNQLAEVIEQIKTLSNYRTHHISLWIPQHLIGRHRVATITPCTSSLLFEVYEDKISLYLSQRSGDTPIGVPFNTFEYAALLLMVAQVTNLVPYELVHGIMDAHIYEDQLPAVYEVISREDRKFPTLEVNPDVKNLFQFRADDFILKEYDPHPKINIPISI